MSAIRKSLLQFVFSGAYMKRWNDKLRPTELSEVDKQGHKMLVAWLLYTVAARDMPLAERLALGEKIIEGGLFEYFYRLVITDIKPPVFYKLKENREHYAQLSRWVEGELKSIVSPLDENFWKRFENWLAEQINPAPGPDLARDILNAAHTYASYWEFSIIRPLNHFDEEMEGIDRSFVEKLEALREAPGVRELLPKSEEPRALGRMATLCGQLRFQTRWSQVPRIPETSVLGHVFMVAAYVYFFSLTQGACRARCQNNFFAGLLHDIPELLTRDIISPVKRSVEAMEGIIKEYENSELEARIFGLLRAGGHSFVAERMKYLLGLELGSEFKESVISDGRVRGIGFRELNSEYNRDELDPKDGELLKICDSLAAYLEAYTALRNGIASASLDEAVWRIKNKLLDYDKAYPELHVAALLADFD